MWSWKSCSRAIQEVCCSWEQYGLIISSVLVLEQALMRWCPTTAAGMGQLEQNVLFVLAKQASRKILICWICGRWEAAESSTSVRVSDTTFTTKRPSWTEAELSIQRITETWFNVFADVWLFLLKLLLMGGLRDTGLLSLSQVSSRFRMLTWNIGCKCFLCISCLNIDFSPSVSALSPPWAPLPTSCSFFLYSNLLLSLHSSLEVQGPSLNEVFWGLKCWIWFEAHRSTLERTVRCAW